jgi:hypothetical protein
MAMFAFTAEAKPKNMKLFKAAYPKSALNDCLVCHAEQETYTRNSYGQDLEKNALNFKAVEALDSDGDGATNLAEITAGSYPGDKSAVPAVEGAN